MTPARLCTTVVRKWNALSLFVLLLFFFLSSAFSTPAHTLANVPGKLLDISKKKVGFSLHGIEANLENLDTGKANGPNNILNALLKSCAHSVSQYSYLFFTKLIEEGRLPSDW